MTSIISERRRSRRPTLGAVSFSFAVAAWFVSFVVMLVAVLVKPQDDDFIAWFLIGAACLGVFGMCIASVTLGIMSLLGRRGDTVFPVLGIVLSVLPFVFVAAAMVKSTITPPSRHFVPETHLDPELETIAADLNREAGIMLDDSTQFNNAAALASNTIVLRITLLRFLADQIMKDDFITQMRPQVIGAYKTFPVFQPLRARASTVVFQYFGKDGKPVADIKVQSDDIRSN